GGRLVEQQEPRLVQHAGGEREPLFPAARELSRQLVAAVHEPHALHDLLDRRPAARHLVDAGDEVEVLEHRQVLVQAEALRHVADLTADFVRLSDDVVAEALARAAVGLEEPTEHADGRRLAAAVRPEKSADLALGDLQVEALDHLEVAEALAQSGDVDGVIAHGVSMRGFTVTGWPGLRSGASAGGGRASARKTN